MITLPSLHHPSSLEQNEINNKYLLHLDDQQTIIASNLALPPNHPSSTTTTKYMRDNNISKKTNTVQLNKNSEIQKLVPTSSNQSLISSSTKIKLLSTHHHVSSQTDYKTQLNNTFILFDPNQIYQTNLSSCR